MKIMSRKDKIKHLIKLTLIIFFASLSTYLIYNKFKIEKKIKSSSSDYTVIFHDDTANKIMLNEINPLQDNVGLSSKPYSFTINNNLTIDKKIKIKIINNDEYINKNKLNDKLIPKEYIRISIKEKGKDNKIYNLNELENNKLLETTIPAVSKKHFIIRVWIKKDVTDNNNLEYHGLIKVEDGEVND